LKSEIIEDDQGFLEKRPLRGKLSKNVSKGFTASQKHALCANFVKIGSPEMVFRFLYHSFGALLLGVLSM